MISDETFPIDLISDEEDIYGDENVNFVKFHSVNEIHSLSSSENHNSSTETEGDRSMVNSMEMDRLLSTQSIKSSDEDTDKDEATQLEEESFGSEGSSQNVKIEPPKAPIKKKKSFSCHNLNMKKSVGHNYDHIESKVKKLIENLAADRRKTLSRHQSMPVCVKQAPVIDETKPADLEKDDSDIKRELRRKSIKIYELEEKCEMKDNQIFELEREKSRMRMIFDKLRVEMQELKDMEKQYKKLKAQYSPFKNFKNATIQTDDDSGFDTEYSKIVVQESVVITHHNEHNHVLLNPRQLAFENSELDQTHITEINNTSLDELLPDIDLSTENHEMDGKLINNDNEPTLAKPKHKKKKKLRFFRFVPCVSFHK